MYRRVIAATTLPDGPRIDSLRALAEQHRDFFDARYLLGDELLHRGPLVGSSRREALGALGAARHLRPDLTDGSIGYRQIWFSRCFGH